MTEKRNLFMRFQSFFNCTRDNDGRYVVTLRNAGQLLYDKNELRSFERKLATHYHLPDHITETPYRGWILVEDIKDAMEALIVKGNKSMRQTFNDFPWAEFKQRMFDYFFYRMINTLREEFKKQSSYAEYLEKKLEPRTRKRQFSEII
jgi:hypothetical protein